MAGIRLDLCGHVRKSLRLSHTDPHPPEAFRGKRSTHVQSPGVRGAYLRADAEGGCDRVKAKRSRCVLHPRPTQSSLNMR